MSIWKTFTSFFVRQAKIEEKPDKPNYGVSWGSSPNGTQPVFPPRDALNAYSEHAYLYAAVTRVSEDLAALPLQLTRGKGKDKEIIEDHPVLELLANPNSQSDGYLFRQQLILDLLLNGTFFVLMVGKGEQPTSIMRLHPEETKFVTDDKSGVVGVINTSYGSSVQYPIDRVLVGRNPSFSKGPQSAYGVGVVSPLYRELQADVNSMMLASQASASGTPSVVISPKDESDIWPKEVRDEVINSYKSMARAGGVIALSGMANIDMLNLKPSDMEYEKSRIFARNSISATLGCPPTILGIPDTANYATALEQRKTYWTNQIHKAKKLDIVFSKLAKLWDPSLDIQHNFNGIEALENRDAALLRIKQHIENGFSVADAYTYEGLEDAPFDRPEEEKSVEPLNEEDKNILTELIARSDDQRERLWREYIERKHEPAEKEFLKASKLYLSKMKKLILKEFDELKKHYIITIHGEQRAYLKRGTNLVFSMVTENESARIMEETIGPVFEKHFTNSYQELFSRFGSGLEQRNFERALNLRVVRNFVKSLSRNLYRTTKTKVNQIIERGFVEDLTVEEVRSFIENSSTFQESRAKNISTTEATKSINAGYVNAAADLESEGVKLQKRWLSVQDDKVRDAHRVLDGVTISVNDEFESEGFTASAPGEFGDEALDINCRCTLEFIEIN